MREMMEIKRLKNIGAGIGDIIQGDEGNGPDRILITALGRDRFLGVWDYKCRGDFTRPESGNTTLSCRKWKLVGNIYSDVPKKMSVVEHKSSYTLLCSTCRKPVKAIWLNSMQVCKTCMDK